MNNAPNTNPLSPSLRIVRRAIPVLLLLTLFGGLLGGYRLMLSLGQPFPGFVLLWRKEYKLLTVAWVTPPNWSGPAAGMQINDRILCMDGYMPSPDSLIYGLDPRYAEIPCPNGSKAYTQIFKEAFDSSTTIRFDIDRGGDLRTIQNVPVVLFDFGMLLETYTPAFLLGLALLWLGWIVFRANPGVEVNQVFCLVMAAVSNFAFNNTLIGVITDHQFETSKITMVQTVPALTFFAALAFHLSGLMSAKSAFSSFTRRIRKSFYILSAIFCLLSMFAFFFNDLPISQTLTWVFIGWVMLTLAFSGLWTLVSVIHTYFRSPLRQARMQARLVLVALVITILGGIPFVGLFFANSLTFPYMQGLPYLGLVVVGIYAYAILRYQLFATRTQTITSLFILVIGVLAALIIYLPVGNEISFVPLLGVSLVAGTIFVGRLKPFGFLDRLLNRESLNYQMVTRFSQQLRQPLKAQQIGETASRFLKEEIEAEQVELWLFDQEEPQLMHFAAGALSNNCPMNPSLKDMLLLSPEPVHADSPVGRALALLLPDIPALRPNGLWMSLIDRQEAIGLLYFGPRWTGEVYSEEDLRLVRLLAAQLTLAIANIHQMERLRSMQRLILQAEESERRKIARELHDTVLQSLLVLTFGLDGIRNSQPQLEEKIDGWQSRISTESSRLRDMLGYLRTPEVLEQRGLINALNQLFEEMSRQTTIQLDLNLDPEMEQRLDSETKLALYRTLREAVNNAIKHSLARKVSVTLKLEGEHRVIFSVQDDGQGFDISSAFADTEKGYNSLQDMRIYIESTGGHLELQSAMGRGTIVQGWAPVWEGSSQSESSKFKNF